MTGIFAAVRVLHFASLMCLWGACFYLSLLGRRLKMEIPARRLRPAVFAGASMALLTGVLWLLLVTGQMSGAWVQALDPRTVATVLGQTRFGEIWSARLLGLVLLCGLALLRTRAGLVAGVSGLVLASLGLVSHAQAASGGFGPARALNDAIHLLTAGFWVGGLVVLAELCRIHRRDPPALLAPFRLFSLWGVYAVTFLVLSGLINAVSILPLHAITPKNHYVDLLGIKVALVLAMIALAAVNRIRHLPALRMGKRDAFFDLKRNIACEIALGAAVIAIVGYLGLMPPV